jgi:hypothetical protein
MLMFQLSISLCYRRVKLALAFLLVVVCCGQKIAQNLLNVYYSGPADFFKPQLEEHQGVFRVLGVGVPYVIEAVLSVLMVYKVENGVVVE